MVQLISEPKRKLFELLLQDHRINSIVLTNGEVPQSIHVNDDGSVTFGRTRKHWWNWLFSDTITKDFETVCIRMLKAFTKYLPPESDLTKLLTEEIIRNAINSQNYESVIDRFVMYAFLGVTEGDYKLNKLKLIDDNSRQQNNARGSKVKGVGIGYLDLGGGSIPIDIVIDQLRLGVNISTKKQKITDESRSDIVVEIYISHHRMLSRRWVRRAFLFAYR